MLSSEAAALLKKAKKSGLDTGAGRYGRRWIYISERRVRWRCRAILGHRVEALEQYDLVRGHVGKIIPLMFGIEGNGVALGPNVQAIWGRNIVNKEQIRLTDSCRITEHQGVILRRRRQHVPALYNDETTIGVNLLNSLPGNGYQNKTSRSLRGKVNVRKSGSYALPLLLLLFLLAKEQAISEWHNVSGPGLRFN